MISSIVNKFALSKPPTPPTTTSSKNQTTTTPSRTKTSSSPFSKYRKNSSSSPQISAKILKQQATNFANTQPPPCIDVKKQTLLVPEPQSSNKIRMSYSSFLFNQQQLGANKSPLEGLTTHHHTNDIENGENENATAQSLFASASNNVEMMTTKSCETKIEKIYLLPTNHSEPRFADEPEYRMENPRRGYAIIINNKHFDAKLDLQARDGNIIGLLAY